MDKTAFHRKEGGEGGEGGTIARSLALVEGEGRIVECEWIVHRLLLTLAPFGCKVGLDQLR